MMALICHLALLTRLWGMVMWLKENGGAKDLNREWYQPRVEVPTTHRLLGEYMNCTKLILVSKELLHGRMHTY